MEVISRQIYLQAQMYVQYILLVHLAHHVGGNTCLLVHLWRYVEYPYENLVFKLPTLDFHRLFETNTFNNFLSWRKLKKIKTYFDNSLTYSYITFSMFIPERSSFYIFKGQTKLFFGSKIQVNGPKHLGIFKNK